MELRTAGHRRAVAEESQYIRAEAGWLAGWHCRLRLQAFGWGEDKGCGWRFVNSRSTAAFI